MFSRSAAGKLFQTVGPLTVELWSPQLVVLRGTASCPDTAERVHRPFCRLYNEEVLFATQAAYNHYNNALMYVCMYDYDFSRSLKVIGDHVIW